MDGEEGAHGEDRDHQHHIIEGVVRPAGDIEDQRQAAPDYQRRHGIDLDDLPQPDAKQPEHKPRTLVEGVGQKAVVAVHEQGLGKAGAPVDEIHDEGKVRQPRHDHLVDVRPGAGLDHHEQHRAAAEKQADIGDAQGGFPQNLPVPFDEQVVEELKALLSAGDGRVGGDVLLIGRLDRRSGLVHLARDLGQQLLVHLPVVAEGQHPPKAQEPQRDPDQEQRRRGPEGQDEAHGGRHIGQGQQERRQQPGYLLEVILIADIAVLLIVPQGVGGHRHLHAGDADRDQQAQPQRHAPVQAKEDGEGQEPHHDLPQGVAVVYQGVGPGVHPQKDHGVVLVPGGVEEAGVHIRADQRQEQQDVQEPEARRRPLVEEPHAADHGEEVEELPQEDGHDLPQHREDVGEDLQPPHLIKPVGQHPFQKGDLLEGVQDAVDPVCIFQGE